MTNDDITIENEDDSIQAKLKKIQEKLKKCTSEKEEYLAGWQRAKADFINSRKNEEESRRETIRFAEENLIKELMILIDGFEAALKNKELFSKLDKDWQNGIIGLYSQLLSILNNHNVTPINSVGKEFNPKENSSIGEIDVIDKESDNIVIEETRNGYKFYEKVIRPSEVKVGKYKE